ncbi:MAG: Folylpolyglutamate synthetase [Bathelium mastoideum]|nr:MAG: Folylpolyglutamate synthetase [Bathelium mastoideum]
MGTRPKHPTYKDALTCLNSLQTHFATLEERRKNPPKDLTKSEALNEMTQWVQDIGYAPTDFDRLNIVHVAGTKGKGTTCAFVNSILLQYHDRYKVPKKVGMYTSPHLLSVCERIRINSKPISEEKFTQYFFEVWDGLENAAKRRGTDTRVKPVYFRFLTLLSFHVFVREQVDVAVYEVGVGGQFDSTNVVARPTVTGVTSLGIDHVQVLGSTIEEIAWHKAGIFKTGAPAFTVRQPDSAMQILRRRAGEKQVMLNVVPISKRLRDVPIEPDEDFQKSNASLAIVLAAQALARLGIFDTGEKNPQQIHPVELSNNETIDSERPLPDAFKIGLTSTVWRGRGETIEKGYGRWLLDGAHTKESLEIVSDWFGKTIEKATTERERGPLCILVFNQQASTRDARQLIETVQQRLWHKWNLKPKEAIFCANVTYKSQGYKLDGNTNPDLVRELAVQHEYAKCWRQNDPEGSIHVVPSIEEAVETVHELSEASAGRPVYILATGSFRLIGGVLTILEGEGIATEPSSP